MTEQEWEDKLDEVQKHSENWYNKYKQAEEKVEELENKIADIKANCDFAIEGRDVKIMELEKENERLKGDLELWESGGCRATNLFECGVVKELKEHHKSVCETLTNTHRSIREQLTKATDLLKKMFYLYFGPCVTHKDLENRDKLFEEIKQLIKEIEK